MQTVAKYIGPKPLLEEKSIIKNIMADEFEVKKKVEYEVDRKSEAERDVEDAGDKIKAGAKAAANKLSDPDRDMNVEYHKEKFKEKLD